MKREITMSNDLKVKTDNAVDGFGGFNDGVEGTDAALPIGVIRGALVKFSSAPSKNDFEHRVTTGR